MDVNDCFKNIKKIWDHISNKLYKDLNIKYTEEETNQMYCTLLLVSYGIRNGTYLENIYTAYENKFGPNYTFENKKFCHYVYTIFSKIKNIQNLDIFVGSIYDNSFFRDTIYIYNKNNPFLGNIKKIENISKKNNNIHKYIAQLLGYDVVKYSDFYDTDKCSIISYIIHNNTTSKNYEILSYVSYRKNLLSNYDKLKVINNLVNKIGLKCTLIISNESL